MAKQSGIIKLEGSIGDITFLKTKDGYLAKEKTSISAQRIATDPAFQRTRENGAEFGRAGKAGKVMRNAFRVPLQNVADDRITARLVKEMTKVLQADLINQRGLRNVVDGEAELLEGFEFNSKGKLGGTLLAPYTTNINRVTGVLEVAIPSFVPLNMIAAPAGTTHFKIVSHCAEIDFENERFIADGNDSLLLPWDSTATAAMTLSSNVTPNSAHPLFLLVGIEFSQEVNGQHYPLKNGAFNAMSLVKVSGV